MKEYSDPPLREVAPEHLKKEILFSKGNKLLKDDISWLVKSETDFSAVYSCGGGKHRGEVTRGRGYETGGG